MKFLIMQKYHQRQMENNKYKYTKENIKKKKKKTIKLRNMMFLLLKRHTDT